MDGQINEEVRQHHHLGITQHRNGSWTKHVDLMVEKANIRLYILRKYTKHFSRGTLKQMYLSYVRRLLEHGSQVWTYLTIHEGEAIEEVQRAAFRVINYSSVQK